MIRRQPLLYCWYKNTERLEKEKQKLSSENTQYFLQGRQTRGKKGTSETILRYLYRNLSRIV